MKRRKFLRNSSTVAAGIVSAPILSSYKEIPAVDTTDNTPVLPIAICTWNFGNATAKAWEVLEKGGNALDAVHQGVMVEENDLSNSTVGNGGRPDRDGNVTLDACIMDKDGNCGAVLAMQNIANPISVARKVMEETPHVMLAGKGAEQFAYEQGFEKTNLLTEESKQAWEEWKKTSQYKPIINIENHDTIGMLAIDADGDIAGACTTSGMAYKMAGRVGDSPIIGAGLFVDNEVGGATATGVGEEVVRTVGSFLIVELMRQGKSPQEACEIAVHRIIEGQRDSHEFQVGFLAVNKKGEYGAYSLRKGFQYSINTAEREELVDCDFMFETKVEKKSG